LKIKKIIHFSIGPIGDGAIGLITLPLMVWFFSVEDIGRLAMLQVTISFCLLLFSLGLDQAFVREFHEENDKSALLKTTFAPGFTLLILALITIALLPWSISSILFGLDSGYVSVLLFVAILMAFFSRFLSLVLRMQERGLAFSMSQILPKLMLLLMLGVYVIFLFGPSFENLVFASVASQAVVLFIFAWNTRSDWWGAMYASIDKNKLNQMIRYAFPLIGAGIAFWGLIALDKVFLRMLAPMEELGIYSVAVKFAGVALIFQSIFSTIWAPTLYKWVVEGIELSKIKNTIDYVVLAVLVLWSFAGIFSWVVAYMLPSEYERVPNILLAAMAYPLLYTLSEATGIGIGIKRKTMFSMWAAFLAIIVNAIGNYFLIPEYGAAGAAMASALAFMVFFIVRTEASSKLWESFDRLNMYILILLGLLISMVINIWQVSVAYVVIMWSFLLVLSLLVYKNKIKGVFEFLYVGVKTKE